MAPAAIPWPELTQEVSRSSSRADFSKQADGALTLNGVARGYQDIYDYYEATRGLVGEALTTLGES
jgi:hypothetical protein